MLAIFDKIARIFISVWGPFACVLGVLCFAVGAGLTFTTYMFVSSATEYEGIVMEINSRDTYNDGNHGYWTVVKFGEGDDIQELGIHSYHPSFEYKKGDVVPVLYNSDSVSDNPRLGGFFHTWFPSIMLTSIGAIFIVAGVLTMKYKESVIRLHNKLLRLIVN